MLTGSILQKLHTAHQQTQPLNFGVYYKNTLVALCHALEDFILECEDQPLLIAAFQQGKWYEQEADRYRELAQKASDVVILATEDSGFTQHPTSRFPNVALVGLEPNDPVCQEWHLIILSDNYTAMVLCQELSAADYGAKGWPENDCERKFYGFWTFEPNLVKETVALVAEHLQGYDHNLAQRLGDRLHSLSPQPPKADLLNTVVSSVVDYLQNSQNQLNPYTQDSPLYQFQDLTDNLRSNKVQALLRMAQVTDQADLSNLHAATEVAAISEVMGQLLDLPVWQVKRLRLAALLHRLPCLQGIPEALDPYQSKRQQELQEQSSELPKPSILRVMPQLQAIAHIISHQNEHWDGSGKPEGLAYDQIPIESRILSLIATFEAQIHTQNPEEAMSALEYCQSLAGTQFDPKLVETLTLLVLGIQQGLQLSSLPPKIASGIWLLDEHHTPLVSLNSTYS
ncbi:DICT sensory domain-containing protein [Roseofilum sp. BLCC_M154]|uniref:DICT sensory domain-containing protein n=1 Tax=Roseofilum acuticapitatum BLCC-M154 TaxID=3022444 RepID=A0ABT7AZD9_9CYAN|nr:DICT sensory domain-containing protein [Roseofilum acuticapitatum]MDJ1172269.1 DICT sensory domain-containing protein [Roseofilum acuticapitatum BLCC-M154]